MLTVWGQSSRIIYNSIVTAVGKMFATKIGCLKKNKKPFVKGSFYKRGISLNIPVLQPAGRAEEHIRAAAVLLKLSWNAGVATGGCKQDTVQRKSARCDCRDCRTCTRLGVWCSASVTLVHFQPLPLICGIKAAGSQGHQQSYRTRLHRKLQPWWRNYWFSFTKFLASLCSQKEKSGGRTKIQIGGANKLFVPEVSEPDNVPK